MDVIGYARVVPGEGGESALQHQHERLRQYCLANKLNLKGFFAEEISGDLPLLEGRTQLLEAIAACGPKDKLLVVRLDRLSSQKKLVSEIFQHCQGKTIEVAAIAGPQQPCEMQNSLEVTVQAG